MSEPSPGIFSGRVGKRITLLFAACAFLPLWALAVLSVTQVRDLLIDQGHRRLESMTRDHALEVLDRLRTARATAQLIAYQAVGAAPVPGVTLQQFNWLASSESGGPLHPVVGTPPSDASQLVTDYLNRTPRPDTLLAPLKDGRLVILFETTGGLGRNLIVAELSSSYVWGDTRAALPGSVFCAAESKNMRLLHCAEGGELDLPGRLRSAAQSSTSVTWSRGGVAYQGALFVQSMQQEFGAGDWAFSVSVPEQEQMAAVNNFRVSFLVVVALSVLLIAVVSVGQIRAMVVPLAHLTAGTRRIAENQFGTQVKIDSDDEFGELGRAFNAMSNRLDRQFRVSQALSEIDRLTLVRDEFDRIAEVMLRQCRDLLPAFQVSAFLLDRADPRGVRRLSLPPASVDKEAGLEIVRIDLGPAQDMRPISANGLAEFDPGAARPAWSGAIQGSESFREWTQPLTWGDSICGWLWIRGAGGADLNPDDRRFVSDLAGRVSLAIAAAWRDEELYQQAHFDPLTGLPNRLLFGDRLQRELARSKREGKKAAVLFVDLDHFKSINDAQGHPAGDQLLREAAARIRSAVREIDTVSRHGGDEFVVLLAEVGDQRDALRAGTSIVETLSKPFRIEGQDSFLSASIGIAVHPEDGESVDELLNNADTAMFRAKKAGRAQVMFYEERMNTETLERIAIDRDLRLALAMGELELYFQPMVFLDSNRIVAAEALLRWRHPRRGLMSAGEFIEIAEESGLINMIGKWVIETACVELGRWRGLGIEKVSVNISARQLRDPTFVEHIRRLVVDAGLTSVIELEITETAMMDRPELARTSLNELAACGFSIALDDFGTGFSSLAYLKQLPVRAVKIDRSFIHDIERSAESLTFVESIIAMAHAMGKVVVAEGVENAAQAELLQRFGCDLVQGYYFAKPIAAANFPEYVANFHSSREGVQQNVPSSPNFNTL